MSKNQNNRLILDQLPIGLLEELSKQVQILHNEGREDRTLLSDIDARTKTLLNEVEEELQDYVRKAVFEAYKQEVKPYILSVKWAVISILTGACSLFILSTLYLLIHFAPLVFHLP